MHNIAKYDTRAEVSLGLFIFCVQMMSAMNLNGRCVHCVTAVAKKPSACDQHELKVSMIFVDSFFYDL